MKQFTAIENIITKWLLSLCLLCLSVLPSIAGISWVTWIPGADSIGLKIAADAHGNSYVAGVYYGTSPIGTNVTENRGGQDIFMAKLDKTGHIRWLLTGGGPQEDFPLTLTVTPNGIVFLTGMLGAGGNFGNLAVETNSPGERFLAKINRHGVMEWGRSLTNGAGSAVALSPNHRLLWIHQITADGMSFLGWNRNGKPLANVKVENTRIGSNALAIDRSGAFYTTGTYPNNYQFVAKYSRHGHPVWFSRSVGAFSARGTDIAVTSKGTVAAVGNIEYRFPDSTNSVWNFSPSQSGWSAPALFLAQHSSRGATNQVTVLGEYEGFYRAYGVATGRRGVYFAGTAQESYPRVQPYRGAAFVAGPGFEYRIQSAEGSESQNFAHDIAVDRKGFTYVTGLFTGLATFGTNTVGTHATDGPFRTFIMRLDDGVRGRR